MTRRGLFAGIPALSLAAQAQAQEPQAEKPTRDQDLETARAAIRANSEALAKVKLPQSTEPGFQFKA